MFLSKICKSVTLIHRRDELRAERTLQKELFAKENVRFEWNSQLIEVLGNREERYVTGCKIKNNLGEEKEISVSGIFIAIGHTPQTTLFQNKITLDAHGYIVAQNTKTNIPGVFAAGDVQDSVYRQAVTSAGTGCMAALEASWYLAKK